MFGTYDTNVSEIYHRVITIILDTSDALPPTAGHLVGLFVGLVGGQRAHHHLQSGGGDLLSQPHRFFGHGFVVVAGSRSTRSELWKEDRRRNSG